ncbi:hypothetical protein [Micrococcus luteus]|uniref:hypothetical protein n=1 Tax=Micrococcus luteus TaxID=1270 RepID=UPI003D347EE0
MAEIPARTSSGAAVDVLYERLRAELPPLADELRARLGPGWSVAVDTAGPHPTVRLTGPSGEGRRPIAARVTPVRCRTDRFHATVGVGMAPGEVEATHPVDGAAPAWIDALRRVGEAAEAASAPEGPVRVSRSAGGGRVGAAGAKVAAARRHGLPLRYAKGWPDDLLGVRTEPVAGEGLAPFLRDLSRILPVLEAAADGRIAP